MEERDKQRVMNLTRRAVVEDPNVKAKDVYERARARCPEVDDLTLRQFNARFVLRAKRERGVKRRRRADQTPALPPKEMPALAAAQPPTNGRPAPEPEPATETPKQERPNPKPTRTRRPPRGGEKHRQAVREVFWAFAADVAAAESGPEVVDVVRRLDGYVSRVMRA